MLGEKAQQIIQLRKDSPLMNSVEIGKEVGGVSKQYVHKILRKMDLNTSVPRKKRIRRCLVCNDPTPNRTKTCPGPCHFQYYRIKVNCAFCHIEFYLARAQITQRHRRHYQNIYCSPKCVYRGMRDD